MKLEDLVDLPTTIEMTGQTDLVSDIESLVKCLQTTRAADAGQSDSEQRAIARRALASAMHSQRRLSDLVKRVQKLETVAITDELTGLLNRRGFEMELRHALAVAKRYEERGVVVYVDLDGFKPINDTYGHAAGDQVLKGVAKMLRDHVRETDYVGRLGGDEFGVILCRTDWQNGLKRAEALDRLLNSSVVNWDGRLLAVRASLGTHVFGPHEHSHEVLARADAAMYQVKRSRGDVGAHGRRRDRTLMRV